MPYIKVEDREWIDHQLEPLLEIVEGMADGQLNYVLTRIVDKWATAGGLSYHAIASVIGALSCVSMEFYRRRAAHYEDVKAVENGEVYKPL